MEGKGILNLSTEAHAKLLRKNKKNSNKSSKYSSTSGNQSSNSNTDSGSSDYSVIHHDQVFYC